MIRHEVINSHKVEKERVYMHVQEEYHMYNVPAKGAGMKPAVSIGNAAANNKVQHRFMIPAVVWLLG